MLFEFYMPKSKNSSYYLKKISACKFLLLSAVKQKDKDSEGFWAVNINFNEKISDRRLSFETCRMVLFFV